MAKFKRQFLFEAGAASTASLTPGETLITDDFQPFDVTDFAGNMTAVFKATGGEAGTVTVNMRRAHAGGIGYSAPEEIGEVTVDGNVLEVDLRGLFSWGKLSDEMKVRFEFTHSSGTGDDVLIYAVGYAQ